MLIRTKLNIPPIRTRLLARDRLVQRLQDGIDRRFTLISAPAGFGKTSLVCQWIEQHKVRTAWYSLDENDNDPSLFFRYFLTALQSQDKSLNAAFKPLLHGQKMPQGRDVMAQVIHHLEKVPAKVFVVLDDYHTIQSKAIHEAMHDLLQNIPPQMHIFITTRHDVPFPVARLRAKGEMTEIRATDLRFTEEEAERFFQEVMRIDLPSTEVDRLCEKTEGWIIGMRMAGLSLLQAEDQDKPAAGFSGTDRFVLDYLTEEVLGRQSEEIQQFLVRTSVLRRLNPDLCREVASMKNASALMDHLQRKDLFLVPLDRKGRWYRYHHLFAESLQRRLDHSEPGAAGDLHRKTAIWYARNGYPEEAFQHAFESGDQGFAAGLLEDHLFSYLIEYEFAAARRWLERMPEEIVREHYLLMLYRAWVVFLQEENEPLDALLRDLEESPARKMKMYGESKRSNAEDLLLALRIGSLFFKDLSNETISAAKEALTFISPGRDLTRGFVRLILALANIEKGDIQPAAEAGRSALKDLEATRSPYFTVHALALEVDAALLQGQLRNAERILSEALDSVRRDGLPMKAGIVEFHGRLAEISYRRNDLDKALELSEQCIEYARPASDMGPLLQGLCMQAFIQEIRGHSNRARESMEEAISLARGTRSRLRMAHTEIGSLQLAMLRTDLDALAAWASARKLRIDEPFSRVFEDECLVLAGFHLAEERCEEAARLLTELRPRSEKRQRFDSVLKIDIAYACALQALGEHQEASLVLKKAVEFARPEGYVRLFVDHAPYLYDLLKELMGRGEGPLRGFVKSLLKACSVPKPGSTAKERVQVNEVESLTPREVEILRMISAGMTNKEIAGNTFVSINTIKTHIRHIFGKLGVTDRDEAIRKSGELEGL